MPVCYNAVTNQLISRDSPSKLDQDVLHALPPGGINQLSDRFPNICNWYQKVLTFPEDERKWFVN